jgi:hypothetical protein
MYTPLLSILLGFPESNTKLRAKQAVRIRLGLSRGSLLICSKKIPARVKA